MPSSSTYVTVIEQQRSSRTIDETVDAVSLASTKLPFDQSRIDFLSDFSRRLGRNTRGDGALQALSFWLRKTELLRMKEDMLQDQRSTFRAMPRGLAFHIPPSNVGTIFVYSLAISMLMGNKNIVRISSRLLNSEDLLLECLTESLSDHPEVAESVSLISYDHNDVVTDLLSRSCDLRVIWGGNETINQIRRSPLGPFARDITFADRSSLALFGGDAYRDLDNDRRQKLVENFYNDAFWFGQLGCSSPRVIVWIGNSSYRSETEDFHSRLNNFAAHKGFSPNISLSNEKLVFSYRSVMDMGVESISEIGPSNLVLESSHFPLVNEGFCGGGTFFQWCTSALDDLVPFIKREHQTLTAFGIEHRLIARFLDQVRGRGVDRVVPVGKALSFSRFWDGYDLFREFTRGVYQEDEASLDAWLPQS